MMFPRDLDLGSWAADHEAGRRPGLWPYGLEALRRIDADARVEGLRKPTRLESVRGRIRGGRRPPLGGAKPAIGLTWHENAARLMVLTRPRDKMYSGVIWVTDRVARGQDTGRSRDILRGLDGLWVISRGQLEPLRDFIGEDGPPIGYIRFGVDADFFTPAPYPERPLVLSVGGDRDRDPYTLFEAMALVRRRCPEAQIVVQTTSDLAPPAGVMTVDHVDHVELRELYGRASVVAIATRENLHASGMTVSLEAAASGRPVVMTRTPGIEDYVDHGKTGLLVSPGDAEAMADEITRLLRDRVEAEAFGRAGRAAVVGGMTSRHLADGLAEFLGLRDPLRTS